MTHDEARELATEPVTLDARRARELDEHLGQCDDCRQWVETFRLAAQGARLAGAHPASSELAAYALASEASTPESRAALEAHFARCADCRGDLERLRSAAFESRGQLASAAPRRPSGRAAWSLPLAAGLAGAALASALFWTGRPPGAGRSSTGGGALPVVWVGAIERGGDVQTLSGSESDDLIYFALAPNPEDLTETRELRVVAIGGSPERETFRISLDADAARRAVAELGFVLVGVPARALGGAGRVRLEAVGEEGRSVALAERTVRSVATD